MALVTEILTLLYSCDAEMQASDGVRTEHPCRFTLLSVRYVTGLSYRFFTRSPKLCKYYFIMAALHADILFCSCGFYLLILSFFPRLLSAA